LPSTLHRRRRVFVALILLNVIELAGVVLVGPGFWIGFSVSFTVLLADLVYLRRQAVVTARRRRAVRRRQAWIAAEQAAVRREHERRAAQRHSERHRGARTTRLGPAPRLAPGHGVHPRGGAFPHQGAFPRRDAFPIGDLGDDRVV
jgi:hypothetical protein